MSSFGQRAAETAKILIDKYGSDYLVNGISGFKGIELNNVKQFIESGLIQTGERAFVFTQTINIGDLITVNGQEWYTRHVEVKQLSNVNIVTRIIVNI